MIRSQIKIPVFRNVSVDDGVVSNNKIPITLESSNNDEHAFLAEQLYAICISGVMPSTGTRGVVVYPDSTDKNTCYWLGTLNGSKLSSSKNTSLESDDQTTKIILTTNKAALGHANGNGFFVTDNDAQMCVGESSIRLHKEGFNADFGNYGSLTIGSKVAIKTKSFTAGIDNSAIFRLKNGALQITGPIDPDEASSGDMNDPSKYLPCEGVFINTTKSIIRCSGITQINSAGMRINLSSSMLADGGAGGNTTFDINVTRGNVKLGIGQGNIELRTNNLALVDSVTIMCGSKISPLNAGISFNALESLMTNRIAWGIGATLSLSKASATLDALKDIKLTSTIGSATLSSMLQTTIEAIVSAKMTAAMLEIEGKAQTIMKGAMLDLKQTKMIDMGPKAVAPTGTGPLCAIPICPFSGAPHVGFCAVG